MKPANLAPVYCALYPALASLEAEPVAQRIQEEEVRKLELWRIENPPGVDHLGRVKRRRSIKGPSLMKCVRQVMNLSGGY